MYCTRVYMKISSIHCNMYKSWDGKIKKSSVSRHNEVHHLKCCSCGNTGMFWYVLIMIIHIWFSCRVILYDDYNFQIFNYRRLLLVSNKYASKWLAYFYALTVYIWLFVILTSSTVPTRDTLVYSGKVSSSWILYVGGLLKLSSTVWSITKSSVLKIYICKIWLLTIIWVCSKQSSQTVITFR